jgi:GntR family transcriptional repressor for pyruvate dehydrogenase complex
VDDEPQTQDDAQVNDATEEALEALLEEVGIGGRLPSERVLADRLGVSRTLLRDRLGLLESLGVIERRGGAGTRVRALDPLRLGRALSLGLRLGEHSTQSLQSVRVALERQAAYEAASSLDHVEIARMRVAFDGIVANESSAAVLQADFDFHLHLLRASCNPSIIFLADALTRALQRTFSERRVLLEQIPDQLDLMNRTHGHILECIASGEPAEAMRAVDACFEEFDRSVLALRGE